MKNSMWRAVLGALLIIAAVPSMASAALTPTVTLTPVEAGCFPKGPLALPVGTTAPTGTTQYKIAAVVGTTETAPCAQLGSAVFGANQATFLQWAATPGATSYRIFRGDALLATVTPSTVGALGVTCGTTTAAARCQYLDQGPTTTTGGAGNTPRALPAAVTQAGSSPDVNINQAFDYAAGTDPDPNGAANSASLKDNVLHFPAGLLASAVAAPDTCSVTELIGSPSTSTGGFGSLDAGEDKCPRASQVGTVLAQIQSAPSGAANPPTPTVGDIYLGDKLSTDAGVTARLFVALRPPCSAGYPAPLNPGGAACTSRLGSATREVEKSFLSAKAIIRQDGTFGIDNETTSVATGVDEDLASVSNIRSSSNGAILQPLPIQVRSLTQTLFGSADQGTAATGDDKPFTRLPTSCAAKTFSVDAASYLDPVLVSGSTSLQATGCANVPFSPELSATIDVSNNQSGQNGHPTFVANIAQSTDEAATKTASVTLPVGLGTNIAALSRVCTVAQQNSAAGCPASSVVGSAAATASVLPGTLAGPVYIAENNSPYNVSGLPKLIVALDGAAKITFDGAISLNAGEGRLINTFDNLPEVTLSSFRLTINGGEGGLLQNTRDLCDTPLTNINATFAGYNGTNVALAPAVVSNQAYYCIDGPTPKVKPGLSLKVKPKKDKSKPFKFTATGKLKRKSAPKAQACKGKVILVVKKGKKTLDKAKATVKKSCTYKAKIKLSKKAGKKGKAVVSARFNGNSVLKKSNTVKKSVKYGKKGKKGKGGKKGK